jgi:hypothetical protein
MQTDKYRTTKCCRLDLLSSIENTNKKESTHRIREINVKEFLKEKEAEFKAKKLKPKKKQKNGDRNQE